MLKGHGLLVTLLGKFAHFGGICSGTSLLLYRSSFLFFTGDNDNLFAGVALSASTFVVVIGAAWIWIVYRAIKALSFK
jgi:polyferredoxin